MNQLNIYLIAKNHRIVRGFNYLKSTFKLTIKVIDSLDAVDCSEPNSNVIHLIIVGIERCYNKSQIETIHFMNKNHPYMKIIMLQKNNKKLIQRVNQRVFGFLKKNGDENNLEYVIDRALVLSKC